MRWAVVALIAALTVAVHAESDSDDSKVLVLTKKNFHDTIDSTEFILVEFYAPWCGHCKSLAPQYEAAAKSLAESSSPIKLAKVDATEETELATEFGVKGYPTMIFFKKGNKKEYTGGRTSSEIVTWVTKNSGPPAVELKDVEEAKAFISEKDVVVIAYLASDKADAYTKAADSIDSVVFGIVSSEDVAKELEAKMGTIVMYRPFEGEEKTATLPGDSTKAEIVAFISANQLPLVTTFSDETAGKIFGGDIKTHLLAFYSNEDDNSKEMKNSLVTVAKQFKGKILFVQIDTATPEAERILEFFALEKKDLPCVRLIEIAEEMRRFKPEFDGIVEDKLKAFLTDYTDGKLQPHLNSEEVPEDWDSKAVKVLVGKNFDEVARDKSKHVFVEFYAPWCGHCKQLAPIWDELGEHFKENDDVVIAKIDSTKNEIDGIQISGFPTLKFFPKESDKILDYKGERKLAPLIKYVEQHMDGTAPVEEEEGEEEPPEDEEPPEEEGVEEEEDTHDEL